MAQDLADAGLIGLGTMGAALTLNLAENGYRMAVFNRTPSRTDAFVDGAGDLSGLIVPTKTIEDFVAKITRPRKIILLVPAGAIVDAQIEALTPHLEEGDIVVDGGNANFHDTNRRAQSTKDQQWMFFGLGVSGGEDGARHGPSLMGGGDRKAWDALAPMLTAISAKHTDGTPCAAWLGEEGAGHFVKMVHNGIEYADMQMIAEVYGILRDVHGWGSAQIGDLFARWNDGVLKSYLMEISAEVARTGDPQTQAPLLDVILDKAGQKGTGRWTAIEAQHLATPVPVIEAAVEARNISARMEERAKASELFALPERTTIGEPDLAALEGALIAGKIACYAQGFAMLNAAAHGFGWSTPMPEVARVWRAGCIIRSAMLDDMASALERGADSLMFDEVFAKLMRDNAGHLRSSVIAALGHEQPVPCLASALTWYDQLRRKRSTANMIQGQRDFFGLHGFERTDQDGAFHGPWADN